MTSENHPKAFNSQNPQQLSYLLRLWQEEPDGPWRIILLETTSPNRHGFPNLEKLFHYLAAQIDAE